MKRNLQATPESECPESELWVRVALTGRGNTKIEVKDHKVRRMDQNQIVVGTYTDNIDL
jgi:hypothetical protein